MPAPAHAQLSELIEPEALQARLGDAHWRVIDATTLMTPQPVGPSRIDSGRPQWEAGHIPGSVHGCMVADFSDPHGPYPYTLPSQAQLADALSRWGITPDQHLVIAVEAQPMVATRVWWVLRALGHARVSVLNGGLPRWRAEGRPWVSDTTPPPPSRYVFDAPPPDGWVVDADAVAAAQAPEAVVNALSAEQFEGRGGAHYGRPGRIPGSLSLPAASLLHDGGMNWRSPAELSAAFAAAGVQPGQRVLAYCGGGIAATVAAFAWRSLGEVAAVYDRSLLEWSADPARPMATGPLGDG